MQAPFTTTFSKVPEQTYISTEQVDKILNNFSYDNPSESVYKISGVRGSGKTVLLAKIEDSLNNDITYKDKWLVADLNPSRDILVQLAAFLIKNGFGTERQFNSFNASINVLGNGGGFGYATEKQNQFFDIGIEIEEMLKRAQKKKIKIFIGIDEVSKSKEMIQFTLEFGKWLRANYPVYLVCTGLYENVTELSNVKNLTFFQRATTIKTEALNEISMTNMYVRKLNIPIEEAKLLAKATKGYAYAFQQLGVLYFNMKLDEKLDDIFEKLKEALFSYSYQKIWEELSDNDRLFLRTLSENREYKREEILELLGSSSGIYSVYRDRLLKRGIIKSRTAYVSLTLPYFATFIKEYC